MDQATTENLEKPPLVFREEDHSYQRGGVPRLGVTEVLKDNGFIDVEFCTEEGRARGRAVHLAIKILLDHQMNWNRLGNVDDRVLPYIMAFETWLKDTGSIPLFWEIPLDHPIYPFAGTFDIIVLQNNLLLLPDFKTGGQRKSTALQTAAYNLLIQANAELFMQDERISKTMLSKWNVAHGIRAGQLHRCGLHLQPNAKYRQTPFYTDPHDERMFLSALACTQWRINNGQDRSRSDGQDK